MSNISHSANVSMILRNGSQSVGISHLGVGFFVASESIKLESHYCIIVVSIDGNDSAIRVRLEDDIACGVRTRFQCVGIIS